MDDLFLKIGAGEIPSHKIYEDHKIFAFLDINPVNHGHTLVIPKKRYRDIYDIPEDLWTDLMLVVKKLTPAIKKATKADGINLAMNNGAAAGQQVWHTHVHIIPRFKDDGFKHWLGDGYRKEEAATMAQAIVKELT